MSDTNIREAAGQVAHAAADLAGLANELRAAFREGRLFSGPQSKAADIEAKAWDLFVRLWSASHGVNSSGYKETFEFCREAARAWVYSRGVKSND